LARQSSGYASAPSWCVNATSVIQHLCGACSRVTLEREGIRPAHPPSKLSNQRPDSWTLRTIPQTIIPDLR
jgi:hypothetical protein